MSEGEQEVDAARRNLAVGGVAWEAAVSEEVHEAAAAPANVAVAGVAVGKVVTAAGAWAGALLAPGRAASARAHAAAMSAAHWVRPRTAPGKTAEPWVRSIPALALAVWAAASPRRVAMDAVAPWACPKLVARVSAPT